LRTGSCAKICREGIRVIMTDWLIVAAYRAGKRFNGGAYSQHGRAAEPIPGGTAMRVLAATLTLLVSSAAAAQECQTCSMADACIKAYLKATSQAQSATKQAIRDWKQNLARTASAELSSRGTLALQDAMETQVRSELERLKECLAKIR
jgi:hypothetical protein